MAFFTIQFNVMVSVVQQVLGFVNLKWSGLEFEAILLPLLPGCWFCAPPYLLEMRGVLR